MFGSVNSSRFYTSFIFFLGPSILVGFRSQYLPFVSYEVGQWYLEIFISVKRWWHWPNKSTGSWPEPTLRCTDSIYPYISQYTTVLRVHHNIRVSETSGQIVPTWVVTERHLTDGVEGVEWTHVSLRDFVT